MNITVIRAEYMLIAGYSARTIYVSGEYCECGSPFSARFSFILSGSKRRYFENLPFDGARKRYIERIAKRNPQSVGIYD